MNVAPLIVLLALLQQLPQPFETPWYRKITRIVPAPDGAALKLPAGFSAEIFADGLEHARWMARAPNGDVFLAESGFGKVKVLRDADKDGEAEFRDEFATGLNRPFGLAFAPGALYVATNDAVLKFRYRTGQTRAEGTPEKLADLPPSSAGVDRDTADRLKIDISQTRGYNHWTRNLLLSPDGRRVFITVGSATNSTPDGDDRRAAVLVMNPDGTGLRPFANGLRNPVGLTFHPETNVLWTSVNERDQLGDNLVPEFVTSVKDGGFYGWPYSYIGKNLDPTVQPQRPDLVARAIVPDILLPSHSAALGIIFHSGKGLPPNYKGSLFVALHGSINRSKLSGYSIVRIPFQNGKPSGPPEDFLTGFVVRDDDEKLVWGRPVGLLELEDGSMLMTDDGGNRIWRIAHKR